MLKRFLGIAIVLALGVALLPGGVTSAQEGEGVSCGTEEEVTITWIAGTVGNEQDAALHQAERFMALCPNVTVNVVERPASTTDTLAQYQQFFEAQSGEIDVYQIDVPFVAMFAEHLVDLSEYVGQDVIDQYYAPIVANNTVQGRLIAFPYFAGAGMLFYRADLLEKYGLEVPQTWDELEAAATAIQEGERAAGNPDFWGFVFQGNAYEGLTCDALEWQASSGGGAILTPDGVIQVNNPETIAIFDQVATWVGTIAPPGVTTFQEEDARGVWQAGNAAFMRNWGYAYPLGQADDSPIKDLFDVTPLPGKEPGMSAATIGGWEIGVSKYSANPDAAVAFAAYITSYPEQVAYTLERGEQPAMPAVYEDEELLSAAPHLVKFKDILNFGTSRPTAAGLEYPRVSELYYTAVHSVLTGEKDAATAMEELELALADMGFQFP